MWEVYTVGNVAHVHFFREVAFQMGANISEKPFRATSLHVHFLRSVAGEYGHAEAFALVAGLLRPRSMVVPNDTHTGGITAHVLAEGPSSK